MEIEETKQLLIKYANYIDENEPTMNLKNDLIKLYGKQQNLSESKSKEWRLGYLNIPERTVARVTRMTVIESILRFINNSTTCISEEKNRQNKAIILQFWNESFAN